MGPPSWLAEPLSWVGLHWPDADPARLIVMSDAWLKMAHEIEGKLWTAERSTEDLQAHNSGDTIDAFTDWWGRAGGPREHLQDAALSAQEIAAALRALATQTVILQAAFVVELAALAAAAAVAAKAIAAGGIIAATAQTGRAAAQRQARNALSGLVARAVGVVMLGGSIAWMLGCAKQRLEQATGPDQVLRGWGGASKEELAVLARQRRMVDGILAGTGLDDRVRTFREALARAASVPDAQRLMRMHGEDMWRAAVTRAQDGVNMGSDDLTDDRALYWARLEMVAALRDWNPAFPVGAAERDSLVGQMERASRGMTTDRFVDDPGVKRIFVTGFDPFGLGQDPRTGNPSGAVALALDGYEFTENGTRYRIETAMLPVRFKDFDKGMAEGVFEPKMSGAGRVDMILTVSQGGGRFELEHYLSDYTRNHPDNAGDRRRAGPIPGLALPGMLESSLPETRMERARTAHFPLMVDHSRPPAVGGIEGSGGDYLSNEVPRRVAEIRERTAPGLPTGHLHVPDVRWGGTRLQVIEDVERIIRAGVRP